MAQLTGMLFSQQQLYAGGCHVFETLIVFLFDC